MSVSVLLSSSFLDLLQQKQLLKRKIIAFVRSKERNCELALQKTINTQPWTLGRALSFSRNENPSEKYTAVAIIQQSAESHDVGTFATLDHRRSAYKSKMNVVFVERGVNYELDRLWLRG
jgi:hypothetical protein